MNNQEKFTIRSGKLKLHRANSQTISSYPVRFSTDIIFSSLAFFAFFFVFLFFSFFVVILIKNIYILIHIWLGGWVSDKKIFTCPIYGNKTVFFWSDLEKQNVESISELEKNGFRDLTFLTANSLYGFNR